MKFGEHSSFEREVPRGYKLVRHISAKKFSFGLVFNLIALAVLVLVELIGYIAVAPYYGTLNGQLFMAGWLVFAVSGMFVGVLATLVYTVLHELTHGLAYKLLTGERLTFGISWSCAFCGVPNIYVYRRKALIAALSPLVLFTVVILPAAVILCVVMYTAQAPGEMVTLFYSALIFLLGAHFGGSSGDAYISLLLITKYKDRDTLVRDTGPEQYIYMPDPDYVDIEQLQSTFSYGGVQNQ